MSILLSRRNFLRRIGELTGAGTVACMMPPALIALATSPKTMQELSQVMLTQAEKLGGTWNHPEASSIARPQRAPFLPKTEAEVNAYGAKNGYHNSVCPRMIMMPSDHRQDHIRETAEALKAFGKARGWGDIMAWDKIWVYPMMMTGGIKDIKANKQVQVMSGGEMVDIDPVRLDGYAVAMSILNRGIPQVAAYMVPWVAGELHARLPQDTTESEITAAFAANPNYIDLKTGGNKLTTPAIIIRGVVTAPVSILYCEPTDDKGGYRMLETKTRLEPLTGNVTIHLPTEGATEGHHTPFIIVRMPVVANAPTGETEVIMVPGSDVLQDNPKWAPKHRFTVAQLKNGAPVRI